MLIGDKTGPAIIAHTYGDIRPDHLLAQARRIQLTAGESHGEPERQSSNKSSNTSPNVTTRLTVLPDACKTPEAVENEAV